MTEATWRVYMAEQTLPGGRRFVSIADLREHIAAITASDWWGGRFADIGPIVAKVMGPHPTAAAYAQPRGTMYRHGFNLRFRRSAMTEAVVLHEFAHCIQPILVGDRTGLRAPADRYLDIHPPESHSADFAGAHVGLVEQFGPDARLRDLLDAYQHFEVPVSKPDAVDDARRYSDLFAQRRLAWEEATRDEYADARADSATASYMPVFGWGDWMWLCRRRADRADGKRGDWSHSALATWLRPIGRFTPADIRALETAGEPPSDMRMRRLSMALIAVYSADPIWARTALGLARSTCGIDLDELALVGPAWVSHVNHLNALVESRPSRWALSGER